jgi:hypothetical protein
MDTRNNIALRGRFGDEIASLQNHRPLDRKSRP